MGMTLQSVVKGTNVNKAISKLQWAIGPAAFIEQLTEKDRGSWTSYSLDEQALEVIAEIAGRVAGIKVPGAKFNYPRTFKPWQGITNKYVAFWIGAEIVGTVLKAVAPFTAKFVNPVQKIARIAVVPGAVGAIFDDQLQKADQGKGPGKQNYYNAAVLTQMR